MSDVNIIFSHYNDSAAEVKEFIKNKNNLFIGIFIILAVVVMSAITPESFVEIIKVFIKKNYDIDITGQLDIFQTALWIVCLYLTVRYYLINIQILRQNVYLDGLEEQLQKEDINIGRTRNNNLMEYPQFASFIVWIIRLFIPVLHIFCITYKVIEDFYYNHITINLTLNFVIYILCLAADIGYLFFLRTNKKYID